MAIEIGRTVQQRRTELGWSQTELARRSGTTQPAIARLETSLIPPPREHCYPWQPPWTSPSTSPSATQPDQGRRVSERHRTVA
ncbi:helix-turn-helix domain-containing protein [Streptomyces sparsogenes]|uniref:helix-turn-helix transcriptional regulator n=1 Tax=Streptomyces sparsogenes TaxID=67365 RepID=UPI0033D38D2A